MAIVVPYGLKDRFTNLLAVMDPASKEIFSLHQVRIVCLLCNEEMKFASSPDQTARVEKITEEKALNIFNSFKNGDVLEMSAPELYKLACWGRPDE